VVQRVPIKITRIPVQLPFDIKMALRLKDAQYETRDDEIMEMSLHYDMLVIEVGNKGGHNSLSIKDPKRHRNWKHFERVWEICRMKGWSTRLYIESQFHRAKEWNSVFSYPQPSMMYSVDAMRHFLSYLGDLHKKHKYDTRGEKKKRGRETVSLKQIAIDGIVAAGEILDMYIKNTNFEDKRQYKALKIYQSWQELSPFYLWSVPWFHNVLDGMEDGAKVQEYKDEFIRIKSSPSLLNTIKETVPKIEQHFGIPGNIEL